jgi:hypothetical protein
MKTTAITNKNKLTPKTKQQNQPIGPNHIFAATQGLSLGVVKSKNKDDDLKKAHFLLYKSVGFDGTSYLPSSMEADLFYHTFDALLSSSGAIVNWTFAANSAYDPDVTNTGHQPTGFDQMMAFYDRYKVVACSIEVLGTGTYPGELVIIPTLATTTISSLAMAAEQSRSILGVVTEYEHLRLKKSHSTREIWGLPSLTDEDFSGTASTSPSKLWYYRILYATQDEAQSSTCTLTVRLKYKVQFYEKKVLAIS